MGIEVLVKFLIIWLFCAVAFAVAEPASPPPYGRIVLAGVIVAMAIVFVPMIPMVR